MSAPAFRFACTRCGHCCSGGSGHVWIEEPEIEPMARALGMSAARFAERHLRRVVDPNTGVERLSLREVANEGGRCALLVGKNTCSVYAARPQHCRQFPYWERVLTDPAAFEAARATCPGIAVIVSAEVRARAAGELRALYASIPECASTDERCCLERAPEELFATGMEADHALDARGVSDVAAPHCRLGAGRPLACRASRAGLAPEEVEALQSRLRALERQLSYPASYARVEELLRSRGGAD
ncbi:MAG: YkgJ family cysteine cluster protein [Planctomycetes bacterium]|nr:YkgJ family cysteine cluster protein [Planctomycetota bacterium]